MTRIRQIANHTSRRIGIQLVLFTTCCVLFSASSLLAQIPDRSKPPALGPPPGLRLPPIHRFKLSNGLPVILVEKHQVPLVQVNILVRAGRVNDPAGKNGLAGMTADMLDEGAGNRDALQLADAIDFLGASISTEIGYHTIQISLHTPLAKLESALALLADVVLRPTFPTEELERLRKERLTTLMQWHDEPNTIAAVCFNRTLYGSGHPYGRTSIGDEQSLREFKVEDLRTFHGTYFFPNNATLIVVGDVDAKVVKRKLNTAFGKWKAGKVTAPNLPDTDQVDERQVFLVDKPDAAQSVIRIGRIGVPRMTDDYYAIVVMNTVLGGSFTSRLNQNLREEHGYSYGAGSSFSFRPSPGPFSARASVQTDVTDKALVEFMKELNGILSPIPEEELARAKNYVALRYPRDFETVESIAGRLGELVVYDLPDDYFNNYIRNIRAVTQEDVQRVARKYIDPEQVAIVVVGDRQQVEEGVRNLNLGAIEFLSIEDVLGKVPVMSGAE